MNIKNIIESIGNWAKNFIGKILPSSKKFLALASGIVNFIKTTDANHPEVLNTITAIIPGDFDNFIVQKIRAALPNIVIKMKLATDFVNKNEDEIFGQAVKVIQSMEKEYAATTLGALWIHLSNVLTDNGVSLKDLQKLQQGWYDEIGKGQVIERGPTPKQRCEAAHAGEAGYCDEDGNFHSNPNHNP